MNDEPFHERPMLILGLAQKIMAIASGIAAFWLVYLELGWPVWLSAACAVCVLALVTIGLFLVASAFEVRALKKRGLPLVD